MVIIMDILTPEKKLFQPLQINNNLDSKIAVTFRIGFNWFLILQIKLTNPFSKHQMETLHKLLLQKEFRNSKREIEKSRN